MSNKNTAISHFLANSFNEIVKTEELAITNRFPELSFKEMSLIEIVHLAELRKTDNSATTIANKLHVTAGTLTTSTSILEKKGYLFRKRWDKDKRVVRIFTTEKGREAYEFHRLFHLEMVDAMVETLSAEEVEALIRALSGISNFFRSKYKKLRLIDKVLAYVDHIDK
ncbi:MAG: hypothetical protein A2Y17_03380 [Clostridiales bacterium GWF2_38_85]|nr:MAG: hypothetical protein A2Y17_03380 [Clostridiales bacterium GWF2_38_85]